MSEKVSAQNLIKCLTEKEKYKGTAAYLHEVNQFNEKIYDIINEALVTVLLKSHGNAMSKLLALRLFKEIVVSANFTLIDALDEKIEDEIVDVAQYNKKSKDLYRGANYFIQKDDVGKDQQVQKIGSSYVLLAAEIILMLANWYSVDEDGEKTRFYQYYKELTQGGVVFPKQKQISFFKKEEEEKFKKNYAKWLKWYIEKVKQEEIEQTAKNIKSGDPSKKQIQTAQEKEKGIKIDKFQQLKQESELKKISLFAQKDAEVKEESKGTKDKKHQIQTDQRSKEFQQKNKVLEQTVQMMRRDYKTMKEKYEIQLADRKLQNERIQKQMILAQNASELVKKQLFKLEEELKQRDKRIADQLAKNKKIEESLSQLKQQSVARSKVEVKIEESILQSECYQIKISPPNVLDDLQDQNELLMAALQNAEEQLKANKNSFEIQLQTLKVENKNLRAALVLKQRQLEQQKSKQNMQEELIQNIIREDSLLVEDQPRLQFKCSPQPSVYKQKENQLQKMQSLTNFSVSEYLRANTKHTEQNLMPAKVNRPRSLKKTESQNKMKVAKDVSGFSNTGSGFEKKFPSNKLNKTTANFYKRNSSESGSAMVTYYPYLPDYFQPLSYGSYHFKQVCLTLENNKDCFFQNEIIKVSMKKIDYSLFGLSILNKANMDLKMKVVSDHSSFVVEGQKCKKVAGGSIGQYFLKAQEIDLNLRYPTVSVVIGNQRISLSNSPAYDRTVIVSLPITLLDFCRIQKEKQRQWVSATNLIKYSSQKILLGKCAANIEKSLSFFKIIRGKNQLMARGGIQLYGMENDRIFVEIDQKLNELGVSVYFRSNSINGSNLAKVMMQILLFLLQN